MIKRSLKHLALGVLMGLHAGAGPARADIVFRETFPEHRDPERYTRIAQAAEAWRIVEENGERIMRVTVIPEAGRKRGLVIWDLPPMQFNGLSIQVRADKPGLLLSGAIVDRFGNSYVFKPFGATSDGQRERLVASDGSWSTYKLTLPEDLRRIRQRGREVTPFVHAAGEDIEGWETLDFSNRGYKTLFFHLEFPPNTPLVDQEVHIDLKLLELTNR